MLRSKLKAKKPTKSPIARFAVLAFVFALIAAACGSAATDTISLGDDDPGEVTALPEEAESASVGGVPDVLNGPVDFSYESFGGSLVNFTAVSSGRPVVLNFFASWCPTCVAELPDFETVSQTFAEEVQFLGLSVQDPPERSLELLEQTGVTFPTGIDGPGAIFTAFGGLGMPTTVFIDADGIVQDVHTGVLTEASLTEAIQENLLP